MTSEQKFPCPRCGSPQAMSAMYCSDCGQPLGAAVVPPQPVPTPKSTGRSRGRTALLVVTGVVLGLVVLAVIGSLSKPPEANPGSSLAVAGAQTVPPTQQATEAPATTAPEPTTTATPEATPDQCAPGAVGPVCGGLTWDCFSWAVNHPTEPCPSPTATPSPTAAPAVGDFAPIKLAGSGNKVPKFTIPEDEAAIATIASSGSENFVVWSLASDGSSNDLLVNTIGRYAGTVLFDIENGQHSVAFKVEASGKWTITIKPIESARVWDGASRLTGKGDDIVQVVPSVSGLMVATIVNKGSGNIVIHTYTSDGSSDLVVNEIGNYSGDDQLADGTSLIQVESDGTWSISPQ